MKEWNFASPLLNPSITKEGYYPPSIVNSATWSGEASSPRLMMQLSKQLYGVVFVILMFMSIILLKNNLAVQEFFDSLNISMNIKI